MNKTNYIKLITERPEKYVVEKIRKQNLLSLNFLCKYMIIIELAMLFLSYSFVKSDDYDTLNEFFALVSFSGVFVMTEYIKKKSVNSTIMNIPMYFVMPIVFLWCANSAMRNFEMGYQILLGFAMPIVFAATMIVTPLRGIFTIITSLSAMYAYFVYLYGNDFIKTLHMTDYFAYVVALYIISITKYEYSLQNLKETGATEINYNHELIDTNRDRVTNVQNRKMILNNFPAYKDKNVFVMMLDIDYFKIFNDDYGHQMGDRVLREVGRCINISFGRANCYRIGGDEFFIIINTTKEDFEKRLETWQSRIRGIDIPELVTKISCSYGYTEGKVSSIEDIYALRKNADEKLYENKAVNHKKLLLKDIEDIEECCNIINIPKRK